MSDPEEEEPWQPKDRTLGELVVTATYELTSGTGKDILCRMWGILMSRPGAKPPSRDIAANIVADELIHFYTDNGKKTMQKKNVLRKITDLYAEFNSLCNTGVPDRNERWMANRYEPFLTRCHEVVLIKPGPRWKKNPKKDQTEEVEGTEDDDAHLQQNVKEAEETPSQTIRRERIEEREKKRLQRMRLTEEAGQIKGALELEEGVNSQDEMTERGDTRRRSQDTEEDMELQLEVGGAGGGGDGEYDRLQEEPMECSPLQEVPTHSCRLCLVLGFEGSLQTVRDHTFTHEGLDNFNEEERLECCRPIDEESEDEESEAQADPVVDTQQQENVGGARSKTSVRTPGSALPTQGSNSQGGWRQTTADSDEEEDMSVPGSSQTVASSQGSQMEIPCFGMTRIHHSSNEIHLSVLNLGSSQTGVYEITEEFDFQEKEDDPHKTPFGRFSTKKKPRKINQDNLQYVDVKRTYPKKLTAYFRDPTELQDSALFPAEMAVMTNGLKLWKAFPACDTRALPEDPNPSNLNTKAYVYCLLDWDRLKKVWEDVKNGPVGTRFMVVCDNIFYWGEGVGLRSTAHITEARAGARDPMQRKGTRAKLDKMKKGTRVGIQKVFFGQHKDGAASCEAALQRAFALRNLCQERPTKFRGDSNDWDPDRKEKFGCILAFEAFKKIEEYLNDSDSAKMDVTVV